MKTKLLVTLFSIFALSTNAIAASAQIVATYDDMKVTTKNLSKEFHAILQNQSFDKMDKEQKTQLIKGYVDKKLLLKEAKKIKISQSAEFKKDLSKIKEQLMLSAIIKKYVESNSSDKMIDTEYNEFVTKQKGKKEYKIAHILVDTEKEAKEIKSKLDAGKAFSAIAKDLSKDPGSKTKGGELGGYVSKENRLVPAFANAAFKLKKHEVSAPVQTQFGWHIIKMLDSRKVKIPKKEEILPQLKNFASAKLVKNYVEKLEKDANLTIKL